MKLLAHGETDLGRKRAVNEDYFRLCISSKLFLVADGMGGHTAGDIASRMAVDIISKSVQQELERQRSHGRDSINPGQILEKSIHLANSKILEATQKRSELEGMGTTIVCALVRGQTLHIASVGDSRIYRIRDGQEELLTSDHSWVNMQIKLGNMTLEESRYHPMRNVITRALGTQKYVEVDIMSHLIQEGDIILLCTDGLNNLLLDKEIAEIINQHKSDLRMSAKKLIQVANDRGGDDNITVVLVSFAKQEPDQMFSMSDLSSTEEQETEIIPRRSFKDHFKIHRFPQHPP